MDNCFKPKDSRTNSSLSHPSQWGYGTVSFLKLENSKRRLHVEVNDLFFWHYKQGKKYIKNIKEQ